MPQAIDGGGVDPVDAAVQRRADRGDRFVVVLRPQANAHPPPPIAHAPTPIGVISRSLLPKRFNFIETIFSYSQSLYTMTIRSGGSMTRNVLLAGLLGTVIMFIWTAVAHMALPLGEAGVKQIENEQGLLAAMQSTLPGRGLYLFPHMAAGTDQAQYTKQIASGPSGMLIYMPGRDFSFGKTLGIEFLTQFVQLLIVSYLLSLTRLDNFASRVGFFALVGLVQMVATNVSYWNWYAFPAPSRSAAWSPESSVIRWPG